MEIVCFFFFFFLYYHLLEKESVPLARAQRLFSVAHPFPFSHRLTFLPPRKEQCKKYGTETKKLANLYQIVLVQFVKACSAACCLQLVGRPR